MLTTYCIILKIMDHQWLHHLVLWLVWTRNWRKKKPNLDPVRGNWWREQLVDRKSFSSISHLHQDQGCGPPTGGGSISDSLALASRLSAVPCSCNCPAAVGNALRASYSHTVCAECKYGNRAGISLRSGLCSFIALSTCWRLFLTKQTESSETSLNYMQITIRTWLHFSWRTMERTGDIFEICTSTMCWQMELVRHCEPADQFHTDCCLHMLRMLRWVSRPIITGWNISFWTSATIFPLLFWWLEARE